MLIEVFNDMYIYFFVFFSYCLFGQDGRTPLHCVSSGGHVEAARLLLDKGANTETKDKVSGIICPNYSACE